MWVLQIDDDEDDLEIFCTAVRLFDPAIAYHGALGMEAAQLFFRTQVCAIPDVIFLDINMPRYTGFDCYAIFKNDPRFINTRFIFLSTSIDEKKIPKGCAFMQKQNSLKAYVTKLKEYLPAPSAPGASAEGSIRYLPCLSIYNTIKIRLQPDASESSSPDELITLQLR
jgi:CheY-like chemotaxis protein